MSGFEIERLDDIPRVHGRATPGKAAIIFEGRATSYGVLDARSDRAASAMAAHGVEPGDRIAYLGKNTDLFFELLFGAAKAAAILAPIGWRLAPREAAAIVSDCAPKLLFADPQYVSALELISSAPNAPRILGLEAPHQGAAYSDWLDSAPVRAPRPSPAPHDPALIFYTSGTTGRAKGVTLTHHNLIGMQRNYTLEGAGWTSWLEDDVSLVATPCSHVAAVAWALTSLYNGAPTVVARDFDPKSILEVIRAQRVTKLLLVPAAMQVLARSVNSNESDVSSLRYMLYGASPIPTELLRECMDRFGCRFVQIYGLTETSGGIVALRPEDHVGQGARMRAAGKPLAGAEIAILDPAGGRAAPFSSGEIATRSIGNMRGYWRLSEATDAVLDADGWLRTGDVGYLDAEGYLYIRARIRDMIVSGGENVYPAEVEDAIFGHPVVADVAVIGVPSERWGEEVKAIVVAKPGAPQDPASVIDWARERVAAYKAPKSVDFVEALPRGATGKVLRRELRERYWGGRDRRVN